MAGDSAAYERLTLLVHAESKVGKSTLTSTAPLPILVLDAEGSWRFVPLRKRYWNPLTEPIPQWDGTWDAVIVHVQIWETVELVYAYLTQYPHQFTSVVVDSITELQRRCRDNLKGTEAMRIQDWGVLLVRMDHIIRAFRDMTMIKTLPVRCVVFVAETRELSGKWRPSMQGQISTALPYWVDICGYMFTQWMPDANGQNTLAARYLFIGQNPQFVSGNRVQNMLPDVMYVPPPQPGSVGTDISDMFVRLFGRPASALSPVSLTQQQVPTTQTGAIQA
jgi:hypothetical protein